MATTRNPFHYEIFPLWKFLEENYGREEAFRLYAPYKGAGVIPKIIDANTIEVSMPQTLSNTNYVGCHFGGSLYSMCDPFYMFLLMWQLGDDYIVWDKSARIEFIKPGRGTVKVTFYISNEEIQTVRQIVAQKRKTSRFYRTEIYDSDDKVVAKLEKEIYIRRKNK